MSFQRCLEISGHSKPIYSIDVDERYIYSGGADKIIARWHINSGEQDKFAIKFEHSIYKLRVFGELLIAGLSSGDIHVVDLNKRQEIKFIQQHRAGIFSIYCDQVNNHLYVGDADGYLSVWSMVDWKLLITFPLNCGKIRDIQLGSKLLMCSQDGHIRQLNAVTYSEEFAEFIHPKGVNSVCINSESYVTAGSDAHIKIWSEDHKLLKSIPAHNYLIYKIIRMNDKYISVSRDKTIKIWSEEFELEQRLDVKLGGHKNSVNDVKVINASSFATCSDDGRILIWTRAKEDKRQVMFK